jgi:TonB family protein
MKKIYGIQLVFTICVGLTCGFVFRLNTSAKNGGGVRAFQIQGAPEWQRYTVADEEFSVLLPVVPAMTTGDMYINRNTSRRERILGAYADGVVYSVLTFEKKSLSGDDLIRKYTSGPTEPVTVDGIAGKSTQSDHDDRMGATQVFVTDRNLYVFQALGSKLGNPAIGIPKFLSSIRFEKNPNGNKVVDGPGEQPALSPEAKEAGSPVFAGRDVTGKAAVVTKPEPRYTEEARKNQITGTVILRAVFTSSGAVANIHAVSKLPDGLTEKAIEAARQIRFIPASKDGRFVSMWMQLEYNFNLY